MRKGHREPASARPSQAGQAGQVSRDMPGPRTRRHGPVTTKAARSPDCERCGKGPCSDTDPAVARLLPGHDAAVGEMGSPFGSAIACMSLPQCTAHAARKRAWAPTPWNDGAIGEVPDQALRSVEGPTAAALRPTATEAAVRQNASIMPAPKSGQGNQPHSPPDARAREARDTIRS
jgi:hypothetical protein